jgi:carbonic anhydrase
METLQMIIRDLLATSLSTATVDANGWRNITNEGGSNEAAFFPDNQ